MLVDKEHAIDEQMMERIAARVTAALREDLETIFSQLGQSVAPAATLTVDQVARHLGVSRSTVYAHWREWGGYKLGSAAKAPIRFDSAALPTAPREMKPNRRSPTKPTSIRIRKRGIRSGLIGDAPRFAPTAESIA